MKRWWTIGLLTLAGAAPATVPGTRPATAPVAAPAVKPQPVVRGPADWRKQMFDQQRAQAEKHPVHPTVLRLSDLIAASMKSGQLDLKWTGVLMTQTPLRLKVADSKAVWVLQQAQVTPHPQFPGGLLNVSLLRMEFDRPADQPWMIAVNVGPTYVNISATWAPEAELYNAHFSRSGNMVSFSLTGGKNNQMRQIVQAQAPDLNALIAQRPDEIRPHLGAMLRDLTGVDWLRPGATELYRVFARIPADLKVAQRIEALLPRLDSPAFAERELAGKELDALGRPGVLAALRVDAGALTAEQKARLADFVAQHARFVVESPEAARRDAEFLLGAMEDDDPLVRAEARGAVEALLGKRVDFDASLEGEKLRAAISPIRKMLREAPATQSVERPAGAVRPGLGPVN